MLYNPKKIFRAISKRIPVKCGCNELVECIHCETHTHNTEYVCKDCIKDIKKIVSKDLNK